MKKLFTLLAITAFINAFGQTINIGPNQYAFQLTLNPNFGLFFNADDTQFEFRNGAGNSIFGLNANNGRFATDLEFQNGADYLVPDNRYAFRAKTDTDFGLFFNATDLLYEFRNGTGASVFRLGGVNGNLALNGAIKPGNTNQNTPGAIRYTGTDLEGRVGGEWKSLTAGTSAGGGSLQDAYNGGNTINATDGSVTIEGTDGIVVRGDKGVGLEPIFGATTNSVMYFSPNKSAFRAGFITTAFWDPGLTGENSAAFGKNTLAVGESSFATGDSTRALGQGSFTAGINTEAQAWATALGRDTEARGPGSLAIGDGASTGDFAANAFAGGSSTVTAPNAVAFGSSNQATASNAVAFGVTTVASGPNSFAAGFNLVASGSNAAAFGVGSDATAAGAFVAGNNNIASGTNAFAMGSFTEADGSGSFAMGLSTTALGQQSVAFGESSFASGENAFVAGEDNEASGANSVALGRSSSATETNAFAVGNNASATGSVSMALGSSVTASGSASAAFGFNSDAEGFASFAGGTTSVASGDESFAFGRGALARSESEIVLGAFNTDYTPNAPSSFDANDRLFVIGNGENASNRSDALVMLKNGFMGLGTDNPDVRLTIDDVPVGENGIRLSGGGNYYSTDSWQFGQALNEAGVINGDFVIKNAGTTRFFLWNAYFAPFADNSVVLGQSFNRWNTVYASNGTINTSDAREKKNVQNINYGLETLMKLKPVSYEWKEDPMNMGTKLGFIAQDLLEVVPEVVVTQKRVEDRETGAITFEEAERMGVFYDDLIPVLTKAIQEQQEMIEDVTKENRELREQMARVMDRLDYFEQDLQSCCFSSPNSSELNSEEINTDAAELGQNIPNPFRESTIIRYYLPDGAKTAIIRVSDVHGRPVDDLQLGAQRGTNTVEFHTQGLASGTYLYSLFVDGKFVDTKKMVIAH